jgi:hypothetical protein
MEKQMKMDFIDALKFAKEVLEEARPHIDELNGRLDELDNYHHLDEEDASEDVLELLEELSDLYRDLPVWDTIDSLCDRIDDAVEELEEDNEE